VAPVPPLPQAPPLLPPPVPLAAAPSAPAPAPPVTYALLPGHWHLEGAYYVWVPPETVLRRVQTAPLVPDQYVWRDGAYVWVPTHYGAP
jgi:hypothetical protein